LDFGCETAVGGTPAAVDGCKAGSGSVTGEVRIVVVVVTASGRESSFAIALCHVVIQRTATETTKATSPMRRVAAQAPLGLRSIMQSGFRSLAIASSSLHEYDGSAVRTFWAAPVASVLLCVGNRMLVDSKD
jgi:hypothetical protein